MTNIYTPVMQAPHPSTVSGLSLLGEKILQAIHSGWNMANKDSDINNIYQRKNLDCVTNFKQDLKFDSPSIKEFEPIRTLPDNQFEIYNSQSTVQDNYKSASNFATVDDLFDSSIIHSKNSSYDQPLLAETNASDGSQTNDSFPSPDMEFDATFNQPLLAETNPSDGSQTNDSFPSPDMEFNDGVLYSTPFGGVIKRKNDVIGSEIKNTQKSTRKSINLGENSKIRNDENNEIFSQSLHESDVNKTWTDNSFSIGLDDLFMNSELRNSECVNSDFKSVSDQCFIMVDNNKKPQSFERKETRKDKQFTGNTKITSYFASSFKGTANKNNFQIKSKNLTENKQFHDSLKLKIDKDSCVDLMLSETIRNNNLAGSEFHENESDLNTTPNKNECSKVKKQEIELQDSKKELFSDKKTFHNQQQDAVGFPTDIEQAEFSGNIHILSPSVSNFNFISNSDKDCAQVMLSSDDITSTEVFPNVNKNESFKTEFNNHNFEQSRLPPSKTLPADNSEITDNVNEESSMLSPTRSIDMFASQSFSGICSKSQTLESINIDGLEHQKNNNDNENKLREIIVEEQKKSEKSYTKNMTNCKKGTEIKIKDELGNETEIMESKSVFDSQSTLLEKTIYFKKPIGNYVHNKLKYQMGVDNCKDKKVNNENKKIQNDLKVCFTRDMENQNKQSSNENINNSKSENDTDSKVSETNTSKLLKSIMKTNEKTPGIPVKKVHYDSGVNVMKRCNDVGKPNVNNIENAQNKGVLKYFPCKKKPKLKNKISREINSKVKVNLINERMQINGKEDEGFNNGEIKIKDKIKKINTMCDSNGKIKDPVGKMNTICNVDGKTKDSIGKINTVGNVDRKIKDSIGKINTIGNINGKIKDAMVKINTIGNIDCKIKDSIWKIKDPIDKVNTVSNIDKETKIEPTEEVSNKRNVIIPEMFNKKYLGSLEKTNDKSCGSLKRISEVHGGVRKKPMFVPPWKKPAETQKLLTPVKNFNWIILDCHNIVTMEHKLKTTDVKQIVITVVYREGYTLLNKPTKASKVSRCYPDGLMIFVSWPDRCEYWYCSVNMTYWSDVELIQTFMNFLFSSKCRGKKVCYEAQAVFMLVMDYFQFKSRQVCECWSLLDPMVGCWLLNPDNPPQDFRMAVDNLSMDQGLMETPSCVDAKTQACNLLPVLALMMDCVEQKLVKESLWSLFQDMEMKLLPILAVMECQTICVDKKKLEETAVALERRLHQVQEAAYVAAGRRFQISSHVQLRQVLYDELKLDTKHSIKVKQTTQQGSKSTSEPMLRLLENVHPLPKIILEFRQLQKVKSTYVDGILQHLHKNNTISTTWEQIGAATGRITSSNPNLQGIPKQAICINLNGDSPPDFISPRASFISRPGFSFLAADFQHIEFRIFAHYTQDETLLKAFRESEDIFQTLARMWLGQSNQTERDKTKRIVYSVMYGAGAAKVAEYLHVNVDEANHIINSFLSKFPCLRTLSNKVIEQCRTQGYLHTVAGRLRLFPNISSTNPALRSYSERQAINFIIQGSAADICKEAMLNCAASLSDENQNTRLLMQIHDELVWEVSDDQLNIVGGKVKSAMEYNSQWGELRVPLPVAISIGKNWADMKPFQNVTT